MKRLLFVVLIASPSAVLAKPSVFIVGSVNSAPARDGQIHARQGENVALYAVVRLGRGRRARYFTAAPRLRLRGRLISSRRVRSFSALPGARVIWQRIEPHQHHLQTASPNSGNPAYSNAVLFGAKHGKWLGYDRLEYFESDIQGARTPTLRVRRVTPTHPKVNVHQGLGTMRYRVHVDYRGERHSSAGSQPVAVRGISSKIMRVSFRDGDDLVGQLAAFYNVPNVFGSGGQSRHHQTELFQGADCADVIVGAMRLAGARVPYTSAAGLQKYARPVTKKLLLDKTGIYQILPDGTRQPVALRFGADVRRGDIMLIDYAGFSGSPRGWDHVGVVAGDAGQQGVFDPEDPVMHMGYLYGLTKTPARTEGPAWVQFLRLRPALQRAIKRNQRRLQRKRARRDRRSASRRAASVLKGV